MALKARRMLKRLNFSKSYLSYSRRNSKSISLASKMASSLSTSGSKFSKARVRRDGR